MSAGNIIDLHCHTAGIGACGSGCFVSAALSGSWKYGIYLRAFGVTESQLRREGDALVLRRLSTQLSASRRVAAAVVLAMDGVVDAAGTLDRGRTEIYIPNDFLIRELPAFPNLLLGASVNPYRADALEELEKVSEAGAVLLKWLPSIQHIDPADRRLIPFYDKLRQLGLPLLTHTGKEGSFTTAQDHLADPERLRLPLEMGVTVIAAHAASSGVSAGEANSARLARLALSHDNLYADISALTQLNRKGHLSRALRTPEFAGRLLYGTDMPILTTGLATPLAYLGTISPRKVAALLQIANPWDRDVALKEALGVDAGVLEKGAAVIKHNIAGCAGKGR